MKTTYRLRIVTESAEGTDWRDFHSERRSAASVKTYRLRKVTESAEWVRLARFSDVIGKMAAPWRCSICLVFLCLNLRALLNHINVSHAGSPNFFINCGIDGCPRNYRRYHSLYKHVVSHHKDRYLERPIILPEPPEINNTGQVAAEEPQQPNAEDVAPDILHGNDDQVKMCSFELISTTKANITMCCIVDAYEEDNRYVLQTE